MLDTGSIREEFQKRFASWLRLEPRCRCGDFSRGLEARTADPLWMLARQWQLGEFQAEDAGSPIRVDLSYETRKMTDVKNAEGDFLENASLPLETVVEREAINLRDWRMRVQIGQKFERLLRVHSRAPEKAIEVYRQKYPITPLADMEFVSTDSATRRFIRLMAGRAIDGYLLWHPASIPDIPLLQESELSQGEFNNVINGLKAWYHSMYSQPDDETKPAWQPQTLDYHFTVEDDSDSRTSLVAGDYRNGELDWHSFSASSIGTLNVGESIPCTPTQVSFTGMPNARWWAFEDGRVDFGKMDVATTDLTKMALMQFALIYGDDWFMLPFDLELGHAVRITELVVTDVFGKTFPISVGRTDDADPLKSFVLFEPSSAPEMYFVPPIVGFREESAPLEEVRFLRDEMANMVWAVEHTVPNGLGDPVDGFDAQLERRERERRMLDRVLNALRRVIDPATQLDIVTSGLVRGLSLDAEQKVVFRLALIEDPSTRDLLNRAIEAAMAVKGVKLSNEVNLVDPQNAWPTTEESECPVYRLATTVPDNWIPFLPKNLGVQGGQRSIKLARAKMLRNEADEEPTDITAMSRLLSSSHPSAVKSLNEEAVPRAGVRVQLTTQRMRWVDGETYVWLGRKVMTGKGEGSSGLRFDIIHEQKA
jgi:metal-sulfur cluster biosynthetic enzyme